MYEVGLAYLCLRDGRTDEQFEVRRGKRAFAEFQNAGVEVSDRFGLPRFPELPLFEIREEHHAPANQFAFLRSDRVHVTGQFSMGPVELVGGQGELAKMIGTDTPPNRPPRCLEGGEQQRHEDGDDTNHDQQLDQRDSRLPPREHFFRLGVLNADREIGSCEVAADDGVPRGRASLQVPELLAAVNG